MRRVGLVRCCAQAVAAVPEVLSKPLVFPGPRRTAKECPGWLKTAKLKTNIEKSLSLRSIYEGDHNTVYVGVSKSQGYECVVKAFPRRLLVDRPDWKARVKTEWELHSSLDHPHIITPYLAVEDQKHAALVMEYAAQLDAYSYMETAGLLPNMSEAQLKPLVRAVLLALNYLHEQGIAHRDIKPENVFHTADGVWKLGDFGSAVWLERLDKRPLKLEGTFSFAAPEYVALWDKCTSSQLQAATTKKLDVWSLGATTYDLLVGHAPYQDEEETLTREQERAALLAGKKVGYPTWLSDAAVTFLKAALRNEPDSRPSVPELLRHPWLS